MAVKTINSRVSSLLSIPGSVDAYRTELRQRKAHERRGLPTVNNRVPVYQGTVPLPWQCKTFRTASLALRDTERRKSRIAQSPSYASAHNGVPLPPPSSTPEDAMDLSEYTTVGPQSMWSPSTSISSLSSPPRTNDTLSTPSSSPSQSPAAKPSPATPTPLHPLRHTSLDELIANLRDLGYLTTCNNEMDTLKAMLDDSKKPFIEAEVVAQISLGISALLYNKDAPWFDAKAILKQAESFIDGLLGLRNDLMNEDWRWATLGGPVYNLRRKLKAVHDIFDPVLKGIHIKQRHPPPTPASATEAQVRAFIGLFSPTTITSTAALLSFFANPYFAALLFSSFTTLTDRLDNAVKIISSHVDVLLRACKLITDNKEKDWFDWKIVAGDDGVRTWWSDMLQLHKKVGGMKEYKGMQGVMGLKAKIEEVDKVLRNGYVGGG